IPCPVRAFLPDLPPMLRTAMTFLLRTVLLLALLALPAQAADPIYPPGSRIGLTPPAGLSLSRSFPGFEDRDQRAPVVMAVLPAEAYGEIDKSTTAELLLKQGLQLESREDFPHPLGKALLVIGHQQVDDTRLRKWVFVLSMSEF